MTKDEARTAIKEALANHIEDNLAMVAQPTSRDYAMGYAEGFNDGCKPKPEQEPTGMLHIDRLDKWLDASLKERKQRTWVGLTAEEIEVIGKPYEEKDRSIQAWGLYACAIEQALKEKNK